MKKILIATVIVIMIAWVSVSPASAQQGKINIKGTVTAVGAATLTVESHKGETLVITVPEGFDVSTIQVVD